MLEQMGAPVMYTRSLHLLSRGCRTNPRNHTALWVCEGMKGAGCLARSAKNSDAPDPQFTEAIGCWDRRCLLRPFESLGRRGFHEAVHCCVFSKGVEVALDWVSEGSTKSYPFGMKKSVRVVYLLLHRRGLPRGCLLVS